MKQYKVAPNEKAELKTIKVELEIIEFNFHHISDKLKLSFYTNINFLREGNNAALIEKHKIKTGV